MVTFLTDFGEIVVRFSRFEQLVLELAGSRFLRLTRKFWVKAKLAF